MRVSDLFVSDSSIRGILSLGSAFSARRDFAFTQGVKIDHGEAANQLTE